MIYNRTSNYIHRITTIYREQLSQKIS